MKGKKIDKFYNCKTWLYAKIATQQEVNAYNKTEGKNRNHKNFQKLHTGRKGLFFFFFFNGIQYKTGIRRAFFLKSTHKASIITLNVLGIKI